jgi:hypothetical protein
VTDQCGGKEIFLIVGNDPCRARVTPNKKLEKDAWPGSQSSRTVFSTAATNGLRRIFDPLVALAGLALSA